jgi:hypothetical protein
MPRRHGANEAYRSLDNGDSWQQVSGGLPNGVFINVLAFNPSGHVFAGTYDSGVFRSIEPTD